MAPTSTVDGTVSRKGQVPTPSLHDATGVDCIPHWSCRWEALPLELAVPDKNCEARRRVERMSKGVVGKKTIVYMHITT